MKLRRPVTEDERLFSSVILVLIAYLILNSLAYAVVRNGDSLLLHYLATLSFLGGIISGVLFFLWTRPAGGTTVGRKRRGILSQSWRGS